MEKSTIMNMVADVLAGMEDAGIMKTHIDVDEKMVLIGPDAVLDSIAFVTLFTDLEDRLSEVAGEDVYLLIDEVHAFNPEDTFLTLGVLVAYVEHMMKELGK